MADNENETTPPGDQPPPPVSMEEPIRLVPLSDIDAFVEIRAGSILDEAAILAIQFLGNGDRNASRGLFVQMAMKHFDDIGEQYDDAKLVAVTKRMVFERRAARMRAAYEAPVPPKEDKPE